MVIQTNVLALNSHRNLKGIGEKQRVASAHLSSGYRINSASDDASGLAISEKMRAQIRGLDMASKNTQDGISLVQTAEGGLQEIDNMVQRIRELTVQAANDTNDFVTADRKKLQDEIDQLTQGIDQMAGQVEFNAKKLLDGSLTDAATRGSLLADIGVKIKNAMGANGATMTAASEVSAMAGALSAGSGALGVQWQAATSTDRTWASTVSYNATVTQGGVTGSFALTVSAPSVPNSAQAPSDTGLAGPLTNVSTSNVSSADAVTKYIGAIDKYVGDLQDAKKNGATGVDEIMADLAYNRQAALDIYAGLELASAMTKSYEATAKLNGTGLWFQTGANSEQGMVVGIGKVTSDIMGIGKGNGISTIKVDKPIAIEISSQIDVVNNALQYVTSQRAKLGAVANRLEYTKASLDVSSENLSASESRIRDADMGKEMMKLTAANILAQAGTSMLAQANQNPQNVLQLLR
jgi:flagellin